MPRPKFFALAILTVAACSSVAAAVGLKPKPEAAAPPTPSKVEVMTAPAQAGQFWVKLIYSLPGGPDSVLTRVASGTTSLNHRLPATRLRDSFLLNEPPLTQTVTGQGCVQSKRRGQLSSEVCRGWSYTTADQPPPPPILDSVIVDTTLIIARIDAKPDRVSGMAGVLVQQFCPFVQFKDQRVALPSEYQAIPYCQDLYQSFPLNPPSADQQRKADITCIAWTATGGTISASQCTTNSTAL